MHLGLLTAPFEDTPLMEVADWAGANGFSAFEVACWPASGGEKRRYAGTSHIDVDGLTKDQGQEIIGGLAERGITISGLGYYPNPLHSRRGPPRGGDRPPDEGHHRRVDHGDRCRQHLRRRRPDAERGRELDAGAGDFAPIVKHAADSGVTLAFENCPMIFSYDEWPGGHNIAYSPRIWRRIFEEWGDAVGMNFDPSHLILQMIDMNRFIKEFGPRFAHVHAKDLMIDRDGLYERGILSAGMGWQVPRLCGLGDVDWSDFFSGLYRVGYDGPVIIEHEDRLFEGTDDKIKRGFALARDVLSPFIK
jgi:sugar phosphate isomerase/epimerase